MVRPVEAYFDILKEFLFASAQIVLSLLRLGLLPPSVNGGSW